MVNILFLQFLIAILCSGCNVFSSLASEDIRRRAYIVDNNTDWEIKHENFTYNPIEQDLLINDAVTLSVWFLSNEGQPLIIRLIFNALNSDIMFSPANVTVKSIGGKILKAKGYECFAIESEVDMRNIEKTRHSIKDWVPVNNDECYFLLFDKKAPPLEEEIMLYMNDALKSDGNVLEVPPIFFRKTVKNIHRWGFIQ